MAHLHPCPECSRHVRADESRCPFCAAALTLHAVASPALPTRRLSRAQAFAFGAALATVAGCGGTEEPSAPANIYGGPPQEEPTVEDDPAPSEQNEPLEEDDPSAAGEIYGGPPQEQEQDPGTNGQMYGSPP